MTNWCYLIITRTNTNELYYDVAMIYKDTLQYFKGGMFKDRYLIKVSKKVISDLRQRTNCQSYLKFLIDKRPIEKHHKQGKLAIPKVQHKMVFESGNWKTKFIPNKNYRGDN